MNIHERRYILQKRREAVLTRPVSKEELEQQVRTVFGFVEEGYMEKIKNHPQEVLRTWYELREGKKRLYGRESSPVSTCAQFVINDIVLPMEDATLKLYNEKDVSLFALFSDVSFGAAICMGRILCAESGPKISDKFARETVKYLEETKRISGIESSVAHYLHMDKNYKELVRFLKEDTSGFKLIDEYISQFKEKPDNEIFAVWQVPEWVIFGAKLSGNYYKALYQLIQTSNSR